jgi:hypothetical protein
VVQSAPHLLPVGSRSDKRLGAIAISADGKAELEADEPRTQLGVLAARQVSAATR